MAEKIITEEPTAEAIDKIFVNVGGQLRQVTKEKAMELLGVTTKVEKEEGKGLSTNDYTSDEKTKLAGLANYDHTVSDGTKTYVWGIEDGSIYYQEVTESDIYKFHRD